MTTRKKSVLFNALATMAMIFAGAGNASAAPATGDLHLSYVFAPTGETMTYRLYVPANYSLSRRWPLIVMLHGGNRDENSPIESGDMRKLAEARGYIVLSVNGYGKTGGYGLTYPIVVTRSTIAKSVEAPDPTKPVKRAPLFGLRLPVSVPVPDDDYGELPPSALIDQRIGQLSEQEVMAEIAEVKNAYAIDPTRMYLTGNSMGGTGTLYLAAKYTSIWAAIAPCAGALAPWSYPYARLHEAGVAALFIHGERDEHTSPHWSAEMAERSKAAGVDAGFIEIPGGAHSTAWITAIPQIYDFFDAHQRAATP